MKVKPAVVHEDDREEEGWPEAEVAERGESVWRTLISRGLTPSERLTVGVARLPGGGSLPAHHHEQAEVYYVLEGTGLVTVDGATHRLRPAAAVFIPGAPFTPSRRTARRTCASSTCSPPTRSRT